VAFLGKTIAEYGASPPIWDHTMLLSPWTCLTLMSAKQAGVWFTYTGGMEGWVLYLDNKHQILTRYCSNGVEHIVRLYTEMVHLFTVTRPFGNHLTVTQPEVIFMTLWSLSLMLLRARASIAIAHISYGNSVLVSCILCLSRPGTIPSPDEIDTSCFHRMIA